MASSKQYGKALFEITEELGVTERVLAEISAAASLFSASPDYPKLLDTPAVPKEERVELVEQALGSLDENLVNLIKILSEQHSTYLLPKISAEYSALYDESRGIERAEAVSAIPMSATRTWSSRPLGRSMISTIPAGPVRLDFSTRRKAWVGVREGQPSRM